MGLAVKKVSRRRRGPIRDTSPRIGTKPALSKEYQAVFENTGKAMVIVEEDATISLTNAEFEQLSGYTKEEIEGKKRWTEFVARDDRKRVREYHRLRKTDPMLAPRSFEFRFLDRQKKVKNVVLTIGTIPGTSKSMASLLDITDRKQTEMSQRNSKGQEGAVKEHMVELKKANEALQAEVADLKRKMKQLQEQEELYRSLVENVDFGINLIDAEHNIVMVNAVQSKKLHKSVSELIGKKCFWEFEKRDAVCPNCPGVQATATGQPAEAETEAVRDDGSRFHVRIQAFPILQKDGTTSGFIEVVEDISERKRMEEELRESEERYRSLMENIKLGINLIDSDYNVIMANAALSKRLKKTASEMIGKKCFQEFLQRDAVCPNCPGVQTMATGKPAESKIEGVRDDGRPFYMRLQAFPVFGGDGTATGFIEVVEDITERKRMEEALRESEEHYRILVDNIRFGINLIDTDHTIMMVNAAQEKYFKKPRAQFIGKKCFHEFEKRDAVCPHCPAVRAIATKKPAEVETVLTADDGSHSHARIQAFPIFGKDGTVTSFIEITEIITERKEMEELLRRERETFFSILDKAPYGVILMDKEGKSIYMNPEFTNITGYTSADIPTMVEWAHTAYPDKAYRQEVSKRWKKVVAEKDISEVFRVRCKDDEERDIEFRATTLGDGRVIVMLSDITVRKRMEESLQESEERFKMLAENAPFGISVMVPDRTFEYFNPQFTAIFGYTIEEIPDKDAWFAKAYPDEAYRKEVSSQWTKDVKEDVKIGEENPRVFTVRCKDGEDKSIDFRSVDLKDGKQYLVYDDITDRTKAEEALKQSEERFRRLIETTKVGVSAIDEKGVITYANNRFCDIWGYSADEIMEHHVFDFLDEENQKILKEHLAKRKQGESDSYEITWTRKDGSKVPTILSPTPRFDADGQYKGSYGFITDITERKQMEQELQQSEGRYRQLFESGSDAVLVLDAETLQFEDANRAALDLYGYSKEELFRLRVQDISAEAEKTKEAIKKLKAGDPDGKKILLRYHRKKDGTVFPVEIANGTFISGGREKIISMLRDITERKRMEEELRLSEERYRTLIETTEVGVSAIDEKGVITYANERFCEIWGYSVDEIMGRPVVNFLDEENLKILKEHLAKRRKGEREPYEISWTRKDGSKAPTILSPTPIFDAEGRFKGSYGFITDITERKRMEERLQRYAADLERSNEEVKNFAYIVSHDLRVPLVNLKGYTSELRSALGVIGSNFDAALPHLTEDKRSAVAMALHEDVPEALEFITTSVSRMDSFINAVLQLSRLGRRELKPEPIEMNALVQTHLETLAHQIQERGIKVTVGSLPQVVADRTSMEQIMGNVLGNAVKYLDPERPGQIEVTAETNNGEQIFRIQDNGRGIAEEDMHKVFAPFRRAGKQDTPGEGMGLAYVQTLVRRHGGRIWCESELEKGTTMTFTISQHLTEEGGDHVKDR